MQKKLLFLCIVVNCAIVQASETETINQKDYTEYSRQQEELYHAALIKALCGEKEAIENKDKENEQISEDEVKENEQKNKKEEEDKRKEYYDGQTGWWGSEPTPQSEVGRKYAEYAQQRVVKDALNIEDKKNKDTIWQQCSQKVKEKKNTFDIKVLRDFARKLEKKRYLMFEDRIPALRECKADTDCYGRDHGLSATIFTDPEFGTKFETRIYKQFVEYAAEHDITLTIEELKIIAQNNPSTKKFFMELQNGVKELSVVRDEILNPKKQEV